MIGTLIGFIAMLLVLFGGSLFVTVLIFGSDEGGESFFIGLLISLVLIVIGIMIIILGG